MARLLTAHTLRDLVHCAGCGEVDPQDDGDGYTTCCNKRVCTGWGWSETEGCCGETAARLADEAARRLRKESPARYAAEVAAKMKAFTEEGGAHVHTTDGVVAGWNTEAATLVSYQGETLVQPLADMDLSGLSICWGPACAPAPVAQAPAPVVKEMTAARPAARTTRAAQGDASAPGWELLYDKPKAGAEVGRRAKGATSEYALICKAHGHVHPLARLSDEGGVRKAGGWCPSCSK